jgi:hypothetical protein
MIHNLKPYRSYLIILMAFAAIGMVLSFGAQPGGINQVNGFIAPLIGPWSRCLEPNPVRFGNWHTGDWQFVVSVTLLTWIPVAFAVRPKNRMVRVLTRLVAHSALIFWCLCGLGKVVLEMA